MNKVILRGNVGKDPELKHFENGGVIASFSLATQEKYKDKDGNPQTVSDWHNIKVSAKGLAGVVEKYVRKGDSLLIEGSLKTRSYDAQDGSKRYVTEVLVHQLEMLSPKGQRSEDTGNSTAKGATTGNTASAAPDPAADDDLPF